MGEVYHGEITITDLLEERPDGSVWVHEHRWAIAMLTNGREVIVCPGCGRIR